MSFKFIKLKSDSLQIRNFISETQFYNLISVLAILFCQLYIGNNSNIEARESLCNI